MDKRVLWIVIPAFNESSHIGKVIKPLVSFGYQVLVVDDGSGDNTAGISDKAGAVVLKLEKNAGKGNALRTGFDEAVRRGAKFLITMDGDGQHHADDLVKFVEKLDDGFDVVFSRRDFEVMSFLSKFGNGLLSAMARLFFGVYIHDTQSGMRVYTKQAYKICRWSSNDYAVESEAVARAGLHKLRYCEVPIKTIYPKKVKGTGALDGVKILLRTIKWRLFPWVLKVK